MSIITRFAPSPTGLLHIGNVRTALINWLYARANGGKFILRIDDTDTIRSKQEFEDAIKYDLEWLGLEWDEIHHQSKRVDLYENAKNKLIESGRLYPCFESIEELDMKKKIALSRNLPPRYDRSGLKLTEAQISEHKESGIIPHYRFLMNDNQISWNDGIRGEIKFDPKNISDPVLIRADGTMTYMIATVVDDIDFNITHIIRGEDHISNSATHSQMFEALGGTIPEFAHLSLIKSKEGEISKRLGGFDIKALRESGMHPMAVISFLSKIGSSDPVEYRKNLDEIIDEFDLKKFSKATTNYDPLELERLNMKLTHNYSFDEVKKYLPAHVDQTFWENIKPNLNKIIEIEDWWKICNEKIVNILNNDDLDFTKLASSYLPQGEWSLDTWGEWINKLKPNTQRKGSELFLPIRKALTGMEHGPELKMLLPILGYKKVYARLNGSEE